ncbi:MAG: hypothetical protein ACR2L9_02625 [Solirubrobacteraceae bacterium]
MNLLIVPVVVGQGTRLVPKRTPALTCMGQRALRQRSVIVSRVARPAASRSREPASAQCRESLIRPQ